MHEKHLHLSLEKTKGKAIDGKTIRHSEYASSDEEKTAHKAMHIVSTQVAFTGCVLWSGRNGRKIK